MVFITLKSIVAETVAFITRQFANSISQIIEIANSLPGVNIAPLILPDELAKEFESLAANTRDELDRAWRKPLPSEAIEEFYADMKKETAKAREQFETLAGGGEPGDSISSAETTFIDGAINTGAALTKAFTSGIDKLAKDKAATCRNQATTISTAKLR